MTLIVITVTMDLVTIIKFVPITTTVTTILVSDIKISNEVSRKINAILISIVKVTPVIITITVILVTLLKVLSQVTAIVITLFNIPVIAAIVTPIMSLMALVFS